MNYIFIIIENIQNNTLKQSLLNTIKNSYFNLIGLQNNNNNNGNYQYENKKTLLLQMLLQCIVKILLKVIH